MNFKKANSVRLRISLLSLVVLLGAVITTGLDHAHAASTAWNVTRSVQSEKVNTLSAIAARAANDVWAVGASGASSSSTQFHTLIEHWNGSQWSIVKDPISTNSSRELSGVVALSATNAWAVGSSSSAISHATSPLIEHWDGKQWSFVPMTVALGSVDDSELRAIAAQAANDIWAVGGSIVGGASPALKHFGGISMEPDLASGGVSHALIKHWNGTTWSTFIDPTPGISLNAVTALAPNNVWAVGSTTAEARTPVAFHWDGTQWKSFPTQKLTTGGFGAITALSANNIWAVGAQKTSANIDRPLIEHWNGTVWSIVPTPAFSGPKATLGGITALSPKDIWAVGSTENGPPKNERPLILHWDGKRWSTVTSPVASSACGLSAASEASGVAWAVGSCLRKNTTDTVDTLIIKHS